MGWPALRRNSTTVRRACVVRFPGICCVETVILLRLGCKYYIFDARKRQERSKASFALLGLTYKDAHGSVSAAKIMSRQYNGILCFCIARHPYDPTISKSHCSRHVCAAFHALAAVSVRTAVKRAAKYACAKRPAGSSSCNAGTVA